MKLDEEITEKRQEISTDSYSMSVGEIISLYKDDELNIHPEFQRYFRWTDHQKSRFIESLLLGIPIPSIFVSQDEKGKWEVIDGHQRLSTIFELLGILIDHKGEKKKSLILNRTRYLPSLEGKKWEGGVAGNPEEELSPEAKLLIKRARIDLKIVLNKSDPDSKYELFDRLNTGGSIATDQEVRNCLLLMLNKDFFEWLSALRDDEKFKACIPLHETQIKEQYDLELIVRFLILKKLHQSELENIGTKDFGKYLTDKILEYAKSPEYNCAAEAEAFRKTFAYLADYLGEDSFKKYNFTKERAEGSVLISLFEVIAIGIGFHSLDANFELSKEKLIEIHRSLWKNPTFIKGIGAGIGTIRRIRITIPLGRKIFTA